LSISLFTFAQFIQGGAREPGAFEMDSTQALSKRGEGDRPQSNLWLKAFFSPVAVMEPWTLEHRVFAYESFVRNGESITAVQREFRREFNIHRNDHVPKRDTILRWVNNLRTSGSLMKKKPPGPQPTARTPENVERVREAILQSPGRSARRHSAELQMSNRTVRRILHGELHFHPYKLAVVQELKETDYPQRMEFAQQMLGLYEENEDLMLLMSDEAHFHLNGSVNKQNCRYWAAENPQQLHERPLHSPKVTVWCAVSKFGVIGPYFFEEHGITTTVTSERYIEMVRTYLIPQLRRRCIDLNQLWFQQDGATAHTARSTMAVLRPLFPNHVISRSGDILWPPRSPDLSTCDFFLWGYLKSRVFESKPRTLDELKASIQHQINLINSDLLEKVEASFKERLQHCVNENGHHLLDIIFRP